MNLDDLQSIQNRERQTDSLQPLPATFYEEVGTYLADLREERARVADEEGFDAPDFRRLSDEIDTAEDTVESIYERRVGKVVKVASFAAAGMPAEDQGLTDEERALFETLVDEIATNRDRVLDVLAGEASPERDESRGKPRSDRTEPEGVDGPGSPAAGHPDDASVDAPDAATDGTDGTDPDTPPNDGDGGGGGDTAARSPGDDRAGSAPNDPPPDRGADHVERERTPEGTRSGGSSSDTHSGDGADETDGEPAANGGTTLQGKTAAALERESGQPGSDVARATVHITRDVGEILGVDERAYDLARGDVVTLPEENAAPLLERDAARRLE